MGKGSGFGVLGGFVWGVSGLLSGRFGAQGLGG